MKTLLKLAALSLILSVAGFAKDIPISEIPQAVLDAAKKALPDLQIQKAEKEREWGKLVYELSGLSAQDGAPYEIEITPSGKVLEIEKGQDDDEAEEDDDDKEEEDDNDDDKKEAV